MKDSYNKIQESVQATLVCKEVKISYFIHLSQTFVVLGTEIMWNAPHMLNSTELKSQAHRLFSISGIQL